MIIFREAEIKKVVNFPEAIASMEQAFASYSAGKANVPPVVHLDVPENEGEIHIKAAYVLGTPTYTIKIASGFYKNKERGLPLSGGMMLVFNSENGFPLGLLLDNGYLTDFRTAAAGAVASKYMAPQNVKQVAVVGAGMQGRLQIEALTFVRNFQHVKVYDHKHTNVEHYLHDMQPRFEKIQFEPARSVEEAVKGSQIVITATPSREPLIPKDWIERGTHITALGSDGPHKQELEAKVFSIVDRIVADSIEQCIKLGEIHHAIEQGIIKRENIAGELGDVISGKISGRESDSEITVCDLTGVGVQDAFIAALAYQKASAAKAGQNFEA
ncbi:MAG TPA: ornithine cyclodeaminase family protein [Acidobacteriota bacterium]|nr:ornithine cyclodeaminase family protein [Acidobacteriota bacterium]